VVIAISNSRFPKQFNRSVFIMDTDRVFCETGNQCFVCDADNFGVHRVKCVLLVFSPFVKCIQRSSRTTQFYKGTSFGLFFGSSADLYTGTHERN